jgi:hypothetical protein
MTNAYIFRDGSGTTLTDVKGSANGTISGTSTAPIWNANGYIHFTGGNGATTGDRGRVDFTRTTFLRSSSSTFSFIIIFRSAKNDATTHYIFSLYSNVGSDWLNTYLFQLNADETFSAYARTGTPAPYILTTSKKAVCDNLWHIAVMTYNTANNMFLYTDGVLGNVVSSGTLSGNFYLTTSKTELGALFLSGANYFYDFSGDICKVINYEGVMPNAYIADLTNEFELIY